MNHPKVGQDFQKISTQPILTSVNANQSGWRDLGLLLLSLSQITVDVAWGLLGVKISQGEAIKDPEIQEGSEVKSDLISGKSIPESATIQLPSREERNGTGSPDVT